AAGPVVWQRGLRAGDELVAGRAAEVGADADDDEDFGLDRAVFVARVGRRQLVGIALGQRVGEERIELGQDGELLGRAADDPQRLYRRVHPALLARLV